MKIALLLLNLVPIIAQLIAAVELLFPQPGSGQLKKATVTRATGELLYGLVSTGSLKTIDLLPIKNPLSGIIDTNVATANFFKSAEPTPPPF